MKTLSRSVGLLLLFVAVVECRSKTPGIRTRSRGIVARRTPPIDVRSKAQERIRKVTEAVAGLAVAAVVIFAPAMSSKAIQPFNMMDKNGNKNFVAQKYLGTWYEVASMKQGFAGVGQEDCHCTQGMYQLDAKKNRIVVNTFCAHGAPDGPISGIQGVVKCFDDSQLPNESNMMREVFVKECKLRFPAIPFVPAEPYDIIATDYSTYAIVQGSKDKSFVQIYSRKPKPGEYFIEQKKRMLKDRGFDVFGITDTPQDCDSKIVNKMMGEMMARDSSPAKEEKPMLKGSLEFDGPPAARFLVTEVRDLAKLLAESLSP